MSVLVVALTGLPSIRTYAASQPQTTVDNDPIVNVPKSQTANLYKTLEAVATQGHICIVAEGNPLCSELVGNRVPDLSAGLTLSQAMTKVAQAYDYEVQRQDNLITLKKLYSDPHDLPNITIDECIQAIEDLERVTSSFNPHVSPPRLGVRDPLVGDLAESLTSEQLQAMHEDTPNRGLSVASLDPKQQELVRRIALYYYVQDADMGVSNVGFDLKNLSQVAFLWSVPQGGWHIFGYEVPGRKRPSFRALSRPHLSNPNVFTAQGRRLVWKDAIPDPTDPPEQKVIATNGTTVSESTLEKAVADLNTRSGNHLQISVDDALKSKPVIVVGDLNAGPDAIVKALADIYGLRIKVKEDGSLVITRPLFSIPINIAALPDAVQHVLPEPYIRALHIEERNALLVKASLDAAQHQEQFKRQFAAQPPAEAKSKGSQPTQNNTSEKTVSTSVPEQAATDWQAYQVRQQKWRDRAELLDGRPYAYRNEAIRELRTDLEPKLVALNGRVLLSSLIQRDRQAFANVLMSDCLQYLQRLFTRSPPEFITHFEQVYLTGGVYRDQSGQKKFSLFLSMPSLDGNHLQQQVGRGNVSLSP